MNNKIIFFSFILFSSTYLSTLIVFLLALFLSFFTSGLLFKATGFYLLFLGFFLFLERRVFVEKMKELMVMLLGINLIEFLIYLGIFTVSLLFFRNHLSIYGDKIFVSSVYWDFHWHVPLIQNFFLGDNFPPQNTAIAGVYEIYHFFWAMIPAIYMVLGLNLAQAVNFYSALFLSFVLITGIGLVKQYVPQGLLLLLVPVFILTHGSFKFVDYISEITRGVSLLTLIRTSSPYFLDFNLDGSFGYNGNMFSVFFFLEERQLIFACFALLLFVYFLINIWRFDRKFVLFLAVLFGLFVQWHLFVVVVFVTAGLSYFVLSLHSKRDGEEIKKLLVFAGTISVLTILNLLIIRLYAGFSSDFNQIVLRQYPKINFDFSTMFPLYQFSLKNALLYYLYAYGLRIFLYLFSFYFAFRWNKRIFRLLLSFLPVFFLLNLVQLSPISVYDNHKWLKPFNLIMDVFSLAFFLKFVLISRIKQYRKVLIIAPVVFLTTLSGFIAFTGFFLQKADILYADLNSPLYKKILSETSPSSVFLTTDPKYIFLAGRKSFLSDYVGGNVVFNLERRESVKNAVFVDKDWGLFCSYLKSGFVKGIDYVQIEGDYWRVRSFCGL